MELIFEKCVIWVSLFCVVLVLCNDFSSLFIVCIIKCVIDFGKMINWKFSSNSFWVGKSGVFLNFIMLVISMCWFSFWLMRVSFL